MSALATPDAPYATHMVFIDEKVPIKALYLYFNVDHHRHSVDLHFLYLSLSPSDTDVIFVLTFRVENRGYHHKAKHAKVRRSTFKFITLTMMAINFLTNFSFNIADFMGLVTTVSKE
ncbi:sigma-54-dependent Fis family transcriptional regulator [Sesbania bispinosa]|nr:sigma-54-dependent Fis family transcriptional regulator [Sesbania bispinosa]